MKRRRSGQRRRPCNCRCGSCRRAGLHRSLRHLRRQSRGQLRYGRSPTSKYPLYVPALAAGYVWRAGGRRRARMPNLVCEQCWRQIWPDHDNQYCGDLTFTPRNIAHYSPFGVAGQGLKHLGVAEFYRFLNTEAGFWPSAAKVPTSPKVTVTATAASAAKSAGNGNHANLRCMRSVTINQPASEPASTPNKAVAPPSSRYSMV